MRIKSLFYISQTLFIPMKKSHLKAIICEAIEETLRENDPWRKQYQAKKAQELRAAPTEVKAVVVNLYASAKAAGLRRDAVSTHKENDGSWILGSNMEDGSPSYVYNNGQWFYHSPGTGNRKPIPGGFEEAKEGATIHFTG